MATRTTEGSGLSCYLILGLGELGELGAGLPEIRVEALMDELAEHLDRRPLRADDLAADNALDEQKVVHTPERDALVPLDQELGQLVELFVLAAAAVELDDRQALVGKPLAERLAERRRRLPYGHPTRRVEAAP